MSDATRCLLPIFLKSVFASVMGMFFAVWRLLFPVANPQVPDPGAYVVAGILGFTVLFSSLRQEQRMQRLEEKLRRDDESRGPDAAGS